MLRAGLHALKDRFQDWKLLSDWTRNKAARIHEALAAMPHLEAHVGGEAAEFRSDTIVIFKTVMS